MNIFISECMCVRIYINLNLSIYMYEFMYIMLYIHGCIHVMYPWNYTSM